MSGMSGHTFKWKIENARYCGMKKNQYLRSPTWVVEEMDNTAWYLRWKYIENIICFGLGREEGSDGEESIIIYFEIAILDKCGKVIEKVVGTYKFRTCIYIDIITVLRDDAFADEESGNLSKDSLSVVCRMCKRSYVFFETAFTVARTTIKVEKRSCLLVIEDFANYFKNERSVFDISYGRRKFIRVAFFLTGDSKEVCNFEIEYLIKDLGYVFMKTYVLNAEHKLINCGESEGFCEGERKIHHFSLPMDKKFLTAKENNLLLEGALYFRFQCLYTTGISFNEIEEAGVAYIPSALKDNIASSNENFASSVQLFSSSMKDDLIPYDTCDVEIHTSDRIFVAHKKILEAKSTVFRDFFVFDLTVEGKIVAECFDVDSETMARVLSFIYTDTLVDLQWSSACQLYEASWRFGVTNLRIKCFSFLKNNLCLANARELLFLAHKYQDGNLKNVAMSCIFECQESESQMIDG
ncbi:TD and POZ domain-containing protein 4 [Argiope bruennichi]|uniref:TD and POZ domain-containing protein 4 n=1 Tax=Argiope bruennichi TaxID=94029 RepID=A0A8T0EFH7_ARGBR|nr:TD and POZ domain-containing protein 4 [Argiope bruennichi]